MKILLLAMPDTADFLTYSGHFPNLAIVSLAGNLPDHEVRVIDLVLHRPRIRKIIEHTMRNFQPQLVGLSAMSFQWDTALRVARFVRRLMPAAKVVAGGYHVTPLAAEIAGGSDVLPIDFMVRGEGEATLQELADELETPRPDLQGIPGLGYRTPQGWSHNPDRPLSDLSQVRLPDRRSRMSSGYSYLGMPIEVCETSRGCPFQCKFCSIRNMYGSTFRRFAIDRIVSDLKAIRQQGAKAVFFADDNITYDIEHFRRVCRAIVEHGLNDICYITQVAAVGIAKHPEIAADMDQANFRIVFVGFETMNQPALRSMNKPTSPDLNSRAAELLQSHGMGVIAGCIVGYPEDTADSVRQQYRALRNLGVDSIYAQYLTPYPHTRLRQELLAEGLVVNADDYRAYDGFTCNVCTHHMSRDELYRCLKRETIRAMFDFSQLWSNYFLRNHTRHTAGIMVKATAMHIYNVLFARRSAVELDI